MGKRKVTILDTAVNAVAKVSFFIEAKGLPETAKRFVNDAFLINLRMKGLYTALVHTQPGEN